MTEPETAQPAEKPPVTPWTSLPPMPPQPDDAVVSEQFRETLSRTLESKKSDAAVSEEFRRSIEKTLQDRKKAIEKGGQKRAKLDIQLDRHEAKYVIPPSLVPEIREFIRPFCEPDPYGIGTPPQYTITTLQLDNEAYSLHRAKELEVTSRFKLRARTYNDPGSSPVFMEIKRKLRGIIVKSRAKVPFESWNENLITSTKLTIPFKSRKEENAFLEFVRITREIGAVPKILIRYVRESYFGVNDAYARVTFDRKLEYQPTTSWNSWGRGGRWIPIDTPVIQNKSNPYSGVVLELKTLSDAPLWMLDMVEYFYLERTGHCKYSNAVWNEAAFSGVPETPWYVDQVLAW